MFSFLLKWTKINAMKVLSRNTYPIRERKPPAESFLEFLCKLNFPLEQSGRTLCTMD